MNGDRPVMVDFTAEWCAPCQELLPRLEAAIINAEIEVDLAKVDVSVHPELVPFKHKQSPYDKKKP